MKAVVAILVGISLVLGGVLLVQTNKAQKGQKESQNQILRMSNQWLQTRTELDTTEKVNASLNTNLDARVEELNAFSNRVNFFSNRVIEVAAALSVAQAETQATAQAAQAAAQAAQAAARAAQQALALRDAKINELESERDELTRKMIGLNNSITQLEGQIKETERKLVASEGDREALVKELKRLQAEKAELERQFNDLAILREQVKKLKEELSIARRLEWIRRGLFGEQKGGQKLQSGFAAPPPQPNYDLNVEIRRDGPATVLPPATNKPPTNAPAPK